MCYKSAKLTVEKVTIVKSALPAAKLPGLQTAAAIAAAATLT
jgi:hypothetical protein